MGEKDWRQDQNACCETVSFKNDTEATPMIPQQYDYLNKSWMEATAIDVTYGWEISWGSTPR